MLLFGLAVSVLAQRPEPNSFLNRSVHSTGELVQQMNTDPVVMDRFMRHFAMTRTEVVAMASQLSLAKIKNDTLMTVYNCNKRAVIGSRVFVIKAGALVFVDKYGTPVLKKTCANPLFGRIRIDVPEVATEAVVSPLSATERVDAIEAMPMAELLEPAFEPVPILPIPGQPRIELPGVEDPFLQVRRGDYPWALLMLGGSAVPGKRNTRPETPVPGPAAAIMFGVPALVALVRRKRLRIED